ncbi:anaerobic ribonucleoside-triphosphate reductase [Bifidobacterium bifidum]|uniref:anaerobic ribonucleoside-triphosphate reductase n=1 Tax=Bifidobacterium bifidum TaxID=1681 RepID=UPI0022DE9A7F|nr:anaerobic ribonucleoside-triphosphate reductase [Bifidobacterium bifidum]
MSNEVLRVAKRDGRTVAFDRTKIANAIRLAFGDVKREVGPQEAKDIDGIAAGIEAKLAAGDTSEPVEIADIQTLVERALVAGHHYDVAKAYTDWRLARDVERAKATDVNEAVRRFIDGDPAIMHENANRPSEIYITQRDLLAGAVSKAAALRMLPQDVANAHQKGIIHFHDLDVSPFTAESNCSLINFWDMLGHGFSLGGSEMDSPKSIGIAATQICQIMQEVAVSQYGGQTANRLDEHLAEYAKKDFWKFMEEAREAIPDGTTIEQAKRVVAAAKANEPARLHFERDREPLPMDAPFHEDADELTRQREVLAKIRTRKAVYDAMQTMEYQINSNRVGSGQTPFVTIGFGLGTDWFSREIQRCLLLNRIMGLGRHHRTPIFPKLVFTVRHGINSEPDDPNYDIKQLALECATKRMYPDVVFYENIVKITGSFKAPMGAVAGYSGIVCRIGGGAPENYRFSKFWQDMKDEYGMRAQGTNGDDWVVDIPEGADVRIRDSASPDGWAFVRRVISNASRVWLRVSTKNYTVDCTDDHPWPTKRGRVEAKDLTLSDVLFDAEGDEQPVIAVRRLDDTMRSYDVTTSTDRFDVNRLRSHNCRSFLQGWVNPETGEDEEDGRMNLGVVSVNLPRIALESNGDKDRFWKLLDERLEIAHHALQFRIRRCKEAKPENAPALFEYGAFGRLKPGDDVDVLFRNGRATISLGYIGIAEVVARFYGKGWIRDHSWDEDGRRFGLSIVRHMHDKCVEWERAEGYHYSLYSTPAESLTDRFNKMDRRLFGRVEGVTDHDFYTNSFHYPVWLRPTPMEKLRYEADFPQYASGGFIHYAEFPMLQQNPKALEAVWDYAHDLGIGYLGTNTPIDHCYVCGFEGDFEPTEEGFKCPECGNTDPLKSDVTKRVCGYLGSPVARPMIHGRHEEIAHRVKHMSGETGKVTLDDGTEREWFEETE